MKRQDGRHTSKSIMGATEIDKKYTAGSNPSDGLPEIEKGQCLCSRKKAKGQVLCCLCCGCTYGKTTDKKAWRNCCGVASILAIFFGCVLYYCILGSMVKVGNMLFFSVTTGTSATYHNCPFKHERPWKWQCTNQGSPMVLATGELFDSAKYTYLTEGDVEDGYFVNPEGLKIHYYWAQAKKPLPNKPAIIITHGREMCTGKWEVLFRMNVLWEHGYSVMAFDMRNHGLSDNNKENLMTWGAEEHREYIDALDWLIKYKNVDPNRVGIIGSSMSGGVASIAMGMEPRFRAAWVDSPACDVMGIVKDQISKFAGGVMAGIVIDLAPRMWSYYRYLVNQRTHVDDFIPYEQIKKLRDNQHYFIVSADADKTVPLFVAKTCDKGARESAGAKNFDSWYPDLNGDFKTSTPNPDKKYLGGSSHVVEELYYPELYREKILGFFNRTICDGLC